jgi:hypothetical protein
MVGLVIGSIKRVLCVPVFRVEGVFKRVFFTRAWTRECGNRVGSRGHEDESSREE